MFLARVTSSAMISAVSNERFWYFWMVFCSMSEKSRDCTKFFFDWVFSWSFNSLRKLQSPDFFGVVAELLPGIRRFGMSWPPFNDDLPGWLLRSISYVGGALLGPVFLAGSIVALRNRKRAGIIFLICMPVAVFCLGYPSAGYLVWLPMAAVPPRPLG
jgi:hypothetical protein